MRQLSWLGFFLVLAACPPNIDTGPDGGATGPINVGPAGGLFVRDGVVLDIPAGALTETTNIFVTVVDTGVPEVPMRRRISFGYRISPTSLKFATPIKITLPVIQERVPKGIEPSSYDARRNAGSDAFLQLPGNRTLSLPMDIVVVESSTERLGLFWLTSPATPNVERVTIDPESATIGVGMTQQFTGRVLSPTGAALDFPLTWSVVPARVGTVDQNGLFTARAPGVATITASAAMQSATAQVFVPGMMTGANTSSHENPFPTGNDLYGGTSAAGLGALFAGANGTILSRDAQGQWSRLASAFGIVLKDVAGTSPTNAVAIGAQGTNGVLVEVRGTTPTARVLTSVEPRHLYFDGTFGMAVGVGNDVLIRRDGGWTTESSPSFETLLAVSGDGAGRYVTVGARGSIYAWDPVRSVWDSLYQTQLSVLLRAAAFVEGSGREVWAVGGSQLFHYANGNWTTVSLPSVPVVSEYTGLELLDGRVFVLGRIAESAQPGVVLIYTLPPPAPPAVDGGVDAGSAADGGTDAGFDAGDVDAGDFDGGDADAGDFDGGAVDAGPVDAGQPDAGRPDAGVPVNPWVVFRLPYPKVPRGMVSNGVNATTGYVVGDFGAVFEWRHDTTSFFELSSGFYGDVVDVAAISTDVFAAVNECSNPPTCTIKRGSVIHRSDAGTWEPLGTPPFTSAVTAVASNGSTEVVVATTSTVWKFNGLMWTELPVGNMSGAINDLTFCGGQLWGVGASGAVYKGNAATVANVGSPTASTLYSVQCPTDSEVWVAGDQYFARFNSGTWQEPTMEMDSPSPAPYRAVWAPGGGEAWAYGDAVYGVYWDTGTVSIVQSFAGVVPDVITGLWGSAVDSLYAVGLSKAYGPVPLVSGFALRFNGIQWVLIDAGAHRRINSISGVPGTMRDFWLGTAGGGLLHSR